MKQKDLDNFNVILEKVGNQPLMTMKVLMRENGMGLSDAKKQLDKLPFTVGMMMNRQQAIALKDELEALGNKVSIPGMVIKSPKTTPAAKEMKAKKKAVRSRPSGLDVQVPTNREFDAIFEAKTINTSIPTNKSMINTNASFDTIFKDDMINHDHQLVKTETTQTELEQALYKVFGLVGKDGFKNGERVSNLLSDLIPKMIKERRRIKKAYQSKAVAVLFDEDDELFAMKEATKRLIEDTDMEERIAKETVLLIYKAMNGKRKD